MIGQEYFGVITHKSVLSFVASMKQKIKLILHILFQFFEFKASDNQTGQEPIPDIANPI